MDNAATHERERLLDPIDRISEILFGLIMAVTIIGALSIATAGRSEVRTVMFAALGCNLAWGLVDAVMYLVRTLTERTRNRALAKQIIGADAETARRLIASTLPEHVVAITGPDEIEGMRLRLLALPATVRPALGRDDWNLVIAHNARYMVLLWAERAGGEGVAAFLNELRARPPTHSAELATPRNTRWD